MRFAFTDNSVFKTFFLGKINRPDSWLHSRLVDSLESWPNPFTCQKVYNLREGLLEGVSMKKVLLLMTLTFIVTNGFAQECPERRRCKRSSPCATRESSVLSMMGWGVALFAGIAILCSLVDDNPSHTTTTPTTTQ
jgi:hypothetical protein